MLPLHEEDVQGRKKARFGLTPIFSGSQEAKLDESDQVVDVGVCLDTGHACNNVLREPGHESDVTSVSLLNV